MKNPQSSLPPGFRFHPTDEELILHYLRKKVTSTPFPVSVIADVDIYKFDPWDLPGMADFGEKEWYFFSPRDRKYPNGARPNRAAASGYWKATGTDKIIMAPTTAVTGGGGGGGGGMQENIGVKKALVFYRGKPPKGVKTNWIMHEYRLADSLNCYNNNSPIRSNNLPNMRLDHWVLCRIYKKSNVSSSSPSVTASGEYQEEEDEQQLVQDSPLPPLISPQKGLVSQKSCSFSNLMDAMDYSYLSNFLSDSQTGFDETQNQHFLSNNGTISSSGSSSVPVSENNKLKRENTTFDQDFMVHQHPSKKSNNYRSFPGNNQSDKPQQQQQQQQQQQNFLNHKFLNQPLLLSPYLQYQG